jgi:GT2 family glycosyltransferase
VPRLTILIADTGGAGPLETTLASVLQFRPVSCEVVVVHRGKYEDPYGLSSEVHFISGPPRANTVDLLNVGIEAARGEVVHLLAPGVEVEENWTVAAMRYFHDPLVSSVGPIVHDLENRDSILAAGLGFTAGGGRVVWSSPPHPGELVGPPLAAALYRRRVLQALGGLDRELSISLVDIDLALCCEELGFRTVVEPASRVYATNRLLRTDSGFWQGQAAERLFWRHMKHRGSMSSWLAHPFSIAAECLREAPSPAAVTSLLGRVVGSLHSEGATQLKRLEAAQETLQSMRLSSRGLDYDDAEEVQSPKRKQRRRAA